METLIKSWFPKHYLGDTAPIFEKWQLGQLKHVRSGTLFLQANWKLALDTFCEGYHFATLHKDSVGGYALSNLSDYHRFGPQLEHHRLAFPNVSILELRHKPEAEWGDANDIFKHFQLVHFIYPNISLLISPAACEFFQVYPGNRVGEHITRYHCYWRGHLPLETEEQIKQANEHYCVYLPRCGERRLLGKRQYTEKPERQYPSLYDIR